MANMVCMYFDKKIGSAAASKMKAYVNKALDQELQKQVIKEFKRRKAYARFKDIIWAADLGENRTTVLQKWRY